MSGTNVEASGNQRRPKVPPSSESGTKNKTSLPVGQGTRDSFPHVTRSASTFSPVATTCLPCTSATGRGPRDARLVPRGSSPDQRQRSPWSRGTCCCIWPWPAPASPGSCRTGECNPGARRPSARGECQRRVSSTSRGAPERGKRWPHHQSGIQGINNVRSPELQPLRRWSRSPRLTTRLPHPADPSAQRRGKAVTALSQGPVHILHGSTWRWRWIAGRCARLTGGTLLWSRSC